MQVWINIKKSVDVIHYVSRGKKEKNLMIILIDAEKPYDKIQYPSMIKVLSKLEIKKKICNQIKDNYNHTQW